MQAIILEDSRLATIAIRNFLKKEGVEIVMNAISVQDLAEKLAATASPPAFATVDMILPDGNGAQACKILWEKYPGLPVIMITAEEVPVKVKKELGNKVKDYIIKPITAEKVQDALSRLLE